MNDSLAHVLYLLCLPRVGRTRNIPNCYQRSRSNYTHHNFCEARRATFRRSSSNVYVGSIIVYLGFPCLQCVHAWTPRMRLSTVLRDDDHISIYITRATFTNCGIFLFVSVSDAHGNTMSVTSVQTNTENLSRHG